MINTVKAHTENLEALFQEAVVLHQDNELEKATQLYKKILRVMPGSPLVNYNLGLALFELKKYEEAYKCYAEALRVAPKEHDLLYNFALCAKKLGKFEEVIDAYGSILEQSPEDRDSLYNLGCCLFDLGADAKAIPLFLKVLDIAQDHTSSLNNLACIYHRNGEYDLAKRYYTKLLKLNPEHKVAQHLLASVQGEGRQNPPDQYIEEIFDNYSSRYEKNMVKELQYNVPNNMRSFFEQLHKPEDAPLKTLDLGCGTGLCGEAFCGIFSSITGVDISQNMIEKASEKEIYSSFYIEEISQYLESCDELFDLILAADVFTYIGSLEPIFLRIAKISSPGAYLCFSTEKSNKRDYILRRSGRFAHEVDYINQVCINAGWEILVTEPTKLRKERFKWIEGMIYIATKLS